jgi:SAM-dependent methyltransferase
LSTEAWARLLAYAARASAKPEFDVEERDHRLAIAKALRDLLEAPRDDLVSLDERLEGVFRGTYNGPHYELTLRHQNEWLKGWAAADETSLRAALAAFLEVGEDADSRFAHFARSTEEAQVAGTVEADPTMVLAFGSLFNFAIEPEALPVIRHSLFRRLERILGCEPAPAGSVTEQYGHHLAFARRLQAAMEEEGIPIRDMVDAQSLIWSAAMDRDEWEQKPTPQSDSASSVMTRCIDLLRSHPAGVIEEISPSDLPNRGIPRRRYLALGRLGLDCIRLAMLAAPTPKEKVRSILDLPSGYGRVLRHLKAEYPEAGLTACDIDRDAVDFCAATFGATRLYGEVHPRDLKPESQFDLIWCGSLLTHMDAPMWVEFLDFFESALLPGGVLVVTTHGRSIAALMREGRRFMPNEQRREAILRSYADTGFGYADYSTPEEERRALSHPTSYGISLAQPSWVCALFESRPGLQIITYMENRWGGQDVIGCIRVA